MKPETLCLHAGYHPKNAEPRVVPIVQSTTYVYDSTEEVASVFDEPTKSLIYSRFANPTVMAVEDKIAELEGGVGAMCTTSGQAATLLSILNICKAGDSFISTTEIYGGTVNLFSFTLKKLGIECIFVDANASDEEIKKAYRELARKYHPDNYQNNPLADLAEEKMKEINEAYETITKQRSGGGGSYQRPSGGYGGQSYGGGYQYSHQQSGSANPTYARIRNLINSGDLGTAERLLNEVPQKNGEWYFLSGSIAYRKGWLDEAMQNYSLACQMDPGNMEYRQALAMMQQGGQAYRPYGYSGGMDGLDCCTSLLCLNCLCGGGHC